MAVLSSPTSYVMAQAATCGLILSKPSDQIFALSKMAISKTKEQEQKKKNTREIRDKKNENELTP
jgi:hypothetical protein